MIPRFNMNSITQLCNEWRRLTESETAAIHARDWAALTEVQRQKFDLRSAFDAAAARGSDSDEPVRRRALRAIVEQLMAMERTNLDLLSAHVSAAQGEQQRLAASMQNLRRLHRYTVQSASPAWQSYS